MKKYKALMLDLDGTTVPNHREGMPSQKVIDAVVKAHKKVAVCVATGRVLSHTEQILDALRITNPVILLGGSQIVDGISRKFVYEKPMRYEDARAILEVLKEYQHTVLVNEKKRDFEYKPTYNPKNVFNMLVRRISEEEADEIIHRLRVFDHVTAHKIVSWTPGKFAVNISHAEATKQHGILEVANMLNIETHEIIGVGDGHNDFPLLMACGLRVAMKNAVPELQEIADYIAPSVEEDGVVDVIEKFIL